MPTRGCACYRPRSGLTALPPPRWAKMLNSTTAPGGDGGAPAFVVTVNGTVPRFGIDEEAFARWVAAEGDQLARCLPTAGDASPGLTVSELVYRALSAHVLVGDPDIELNIHDHADGTGFFVRLNNRSGRQILVGLARGRHEIRWPLNDLTHDESARFHLMEVCCIANALLADLLVVKA